MEKYLIVDGSNLLFQMFYGMPARIVNEHGRAIQGTLGFVGALLKIIRRVEPTHIAVLFDGEHSNERTQLDADYKSNRPDFSQLAEEETPFSQLPDVYDALDFMQISHKETTECEVDDWIAAYAMTYDRDAEIVISSLDSDFFQLITDHTSVLRYRGDNTVICDPKYIREKLGIAPSQYADFKSLTGDHADNITGIPGIGPKTAAALLSQFENLETILANIDRISKPSVRASLLQHADRARRNFRLIKLENRISLPFDLSALSWQNRAYTTGAVLKEIGLKS